MKKESLNNDVFSDFTEVGGGKTKSATIDIPSINLPKGGGAIKGIDEKFSVNPVNGSASFSFPLPFSPARGITPSLSLSYNSGAGNGIFGLGWDIDLPSIKRKTEKELPQYLDANDSDTFLFSGAEDLVPAFQKQPDGSFLMDGDDNYIIDEKDSPDGLFTVRYYKPRTEGLFARIERWTGKNGSETKWRITTKENTTTLFGWTSNSRITNPEDNTKIFQWLPEFVFDDKGNCAHYIYQKENSIGVDVSLLHNRNRVKDGKITYTNSYLEKVLYGNKTPYLKFGDDFLTAGDYLFSTVFDYGEYNTDSPFEKITDWDLRTDAFSNYKAGFEVRTTRLCKRVLLFHHFTGPNEYNGLTRSVNFEYNNNSVDDFTFLKAVRSVGYVKKADGSYSKKQLPPMEFEYQAHEWNKEVKSISPDALVHAPSGLDDQLYQFTDLYNEGLAGILTEQTDGWYYKHNLGKGKFTQARLVNPKPSFIGLGSTMQLVDLDADGGKQLVSIGKEPPGFFELDDENEWQAFRSFTSIPQVDFTDPNTRMLDLNGDGKLDIVITEDNVFTWYASEGRKGFSQARKTLKSFNEEEGPHVVFADSQQSIFLADMSGDGLTDIVRIRNGEVCYWPNIGYGRFGAKITLDNSPFFDLQDAFNTSYIHLADIDGSGVTDIIYLGKNKFTCWKNLSGNRFSETPFEIEAFPEMHYETNISIIDLLGNGVACIVWSGSLPKNKNAPLKYIDLMNSKKPHIMVSYQNNLGKKVSLEYTPSTKFYIEDKLAGNPWITKLHFPVHCISKTETRDAITGHRFITSYTYHHGYFDHAEGEFRGFGMVKKTDTEHSGHWLKGNASNIVDAELHQDPVVSKTWVHTGAFVNHDKILNQFAHEYWFEEMKNKGFLVVHNEVPLPDARIIPAAGIPQAVIEHLSATEWQQAIRSCKGMVLRSEVFAHDAPSSGATPEEIKKQLTPYSVATHNGVIELIQPKGKNKFAVFGVNESEAITYSYERNTEDPRIAHSLNIKYDEYGNVLESVAVVYPRVLEDASIPIDTQLEQNKTAIIYSKNHYTNDVIEDSAYRLRLPAEVKTFELKGVTRAGAIYSANDFANILTIANEVGYHQGDVAPAPGNSQQRLIEHVRFNYYRNDLGGMLPLYQMEFLAIPYESYQLAYTPELIGDIFGTKVNAALLNEGKFTHSEEDGNWWIRSGTMEFIEGSETAFNAQNRFYVPVSYTDPYGAKSKVRYYGNYFLLVEEIEDALGNKSKVDLFNFRTLSPQRMRDINNNLSESLTDELGLVKAMAVFGKGNEADDLSGISEVTEENEKNLVNNFFSAPDSVLLTDIGKGLLQHATARFVYDFDAFRDTGKPAMTAAIGREEHFQKNNNSPLQFSFEYSNGLGQVVMKKVQAEPGQAKMVTIHVDDTITVSEVDTSESEPKQLRWIGSGRTILNNKGNPIKQYEPYFSVTPQYEDLKELVETGVTSVIYYDALGRAIKTEMPDGTVSKIVFDAWKQQVYDANDTILESSWFTNRTNHLIDAKLLAEGKDPVKEKAAADSAALHANTPGIFHLDTLGRAVLNVAHNKNMLNQADEFYHTTMKLDAEGNLRSITDARGNMVMQYKYDMLGNQVYQNSMDTGQRWLLTNIMGNPLRTWDERNHEFQYFIDILQRPTHTKVLGGDGNLALDHVFDKIVYGESLLFPSRSNEQELQAKNILGKPVQYFDTGGSVATPEFDFKGNPLFTTRKFLKDYKGVANWLDDNLVNDLEDDSFTFLTETDALGRITRQTAPDGSIITPFYNEAGLLNGETVTHLNPAITSTYIKDIGYNEKGQREKIVYGNDVITKFYYDKETFKIRRLESKHQNNNALQDWHYTFDPVGNISHIEDKSIPVLFFNNQKISGVSEYTYDALYRLVKATGRENEAALNFNNNDNWNDASFMHQLNPGDPMAVRNYTQQYVYDEAGNIKQMQHIAAGNSWTRDYLYEDSSNRLISTRVGSNTYLYPHHTQHGFITAMPHLDQMGWNFKEELVKAIRQARTDGGSAETTFYQYDGGGQRIRKITENQAAPGEAPSKKEERIYISGYELYKKHSGTDAGLERISLSLMDGGERFVMVETRNDVDDGTEKHLVRYQLHNHLGSASLELNEDAEVISYEEYHPYGTTAYQAKSATIKATAKRYRNAGLERDDETGLSYHSARYYISWLGRWLNSDPIGIEDGMNVFQFAACNPVRFVDKEGTQVKLPKVEPFREGMLIGDYPGLSSRWKSAVDKTLKRIYGGGTYEENIKRFEKEVAAMPSGSNTQQGSAQNFARTVFKSARAHFDELVKLPKGTQIHHALTDGELSKNPIKALDASHLEIAHGQTAVKTTTHSRAARATELLEQGVKNPGLQATREMNANRVAPRKPPRVRGQRGYTRVGNLFFIAVVAGGVLYAIKQGEDVQEALKNAGKDIIIGGITVRVLGKGAFLLDMALNLRSDNAAMNEEMAKRDIVIDFLQQNFPDSVKEETVWGMKAGYSLKPGNEELYEEAKKFIFETKPVEYPVPEREPPDYTGGGSGAPGY